MKLLSAGIDPVGGNPIATDTILHQEQARNCFAFVSSLLDEVIQNYGVVSLPDMLDSTRYEIVKKKAAFSLSEQQKCRSAAVAPFIFVRNVNAVIDTDNMENFSLKTLHQWLVREKFLMESKAPAVINKTVRMPTPMAIRIGILTQSIIDLRQVRGRSNLCLRSRLKSIC